MIRNPVETASKRFRYGAQVDAPEASKSALAPTHQWPASRRSRAKD
ncbi:hypothetical protein N9D38_09215 [Rubripirellula sp.]|nr:hypothetical protein [Rubripirellula sp.]